MAARTSVPILLVTGFLGSGKTTLLKHWLATPDLAGALVIVNELGEVGLDDRVIEAMGETPLLLDNGCACCAAGEDLAATLERLFFDRLHRRIAPFTRVLIETTGVARPQPILDLIAGHALLAERYHMAGVVTCFDARRGPHLLATQPECREQLEGADVVVLTKADLVDMADLAFAQAEIDRVRPQARVLTSGCADASAPAPGADGPVPALSAGPVAAADVLAALVEETRPEPGAKGPAHPHAGHAHLSDVSTAFAPVGEIARSALEAALELVFQEFGDSLLRAKGLVRLQGAAEPQVVQAEAGLPVAVSAVACRDGAVPALGMTLIARGRPARDMAAALQSCIVTAGYSIPEGCRTHD